MPTKLRRSVVALATVLACLALMASPASATTHDITITGGAIEMTGVNGIMLDLPLGGSSGTGCGSSIVIDQDATTHSADITSFTSTGRFNWTSTAGYIAEMTRLSSTAGTSSGGLMSTAIVTARIDLFVPTNANPATDCAHGATRTCRLTITFDIDAIYSSTTGDLQSSGFGHVTSMGSSTVVSTPPCGVPFPTFNTGSASIGSSTFHATT